MQNRFIIPILFILTIALSPIAIGCSWLQGACATAMPALIAGQAFAADAAQALDQAEKYVEQLPIGDVRRAKLSEAVLKGRDALRAASAALASTADACSKPDLVTIFKTFIEVWSIIHVIVGGPSNLDPSKLATAPPAIEDPLIYKLALQQGAVK